VKLSRLRAGEAIAAVSAVLLFAAMFAEWYGAEVSGQVGTISLGGGTGAGGSAWQTLDLISLVLMLTVVVAVGAVLLRLFGSSWEPAIPPSAAVAVLGGLSTLLVLFRILVPPDFGTLGGVSVNATLQLGVFLGLATAAAIAYGGYRAMGERGTSFEAIANALSRDRNKVGEDAGLSGDSVRHPLGKRDDRHHRVDPD
jgi:hypothetical protein